MAYTVGAMKIIRILSYSYGFPSNKIPVLDDTEIVFESPLPIIINLSYDSDFLPEIERERKRTIKISEDASLSVCCDGTTDPYILTSKRDKYTLYELANSVVQSALTQKGSRDVWYTYELIFEEVDGVIHLSQNANH
jgi:hypothetical protein